MDRGDYIGTLPINRGPKKSLHARGLDRKLSRDLFAQQCQRKSREVPEIFDQMARYPLFRAPCQNKPMMMIMIYIVRAGKCWLWNKKEGWKNNLLKEGCGKVKVNFSWSNSRLKILALWAFLGIQEMQNSTLSPTLVELYRNHNIHFNSG